MLVISIAKYVCVYKVFSPLMSNAIPAFCVRYKDKKITSLICEHCGTTKDFVIFTYKLNKRYSLKQ